MIKIFFTIAEFIKDTGNINEWIAEIGDVDESEVKVEEAALSDGIERLSLSVLSKEKAMAIKGRLIQVSRTGSLPPSLYQVEMPAMGDKEKFILNGPAYGFAYFQIEELRHLREQSEGAVFAEALSRNRAMMFLTFRGSWTMEQYLAELDRRIEEEDLSYNREIKVALMALKAYESA